MDQLRFSIKPYEGDKPYFFVSYSHRDSDVVLPVLQILSEEGYRFWYDEGIDPGTEWPEMIARHLENSIACISFLSPAYMESNNCRRELHYALAKNLDYVSVFVEPTQLSPGIEMQISSYLSIFSYKYTDREAFIEKLKKVEFLEKCTGEGSDSQEHAGKRSTAIPLESGQRVRKEKQKKKRWLFAALAMIGACAVLLSDFYFSKTWIFAQQKEAGQTPADENESVTEALSADSENESAIEVQEEEQEEGQEEDQENAQENVEEENDIDIDKIAAQSASEDYSNYTIGDTLFFGMYEQDNHTENGAEPIEWIVIEKTEDKLLLLSKYGLYASYFSATSKDVTWADSLVRRKLNTVFINGAFTPEQQSRILMTENINNYVEKTQEKLFCLTWEQVWAKVDGVLDQDDMRCTPTPYTVAMGLEPVRGYVPWWLNNYDRGKHRSWAMVIWMDVQNEDNVMGYCHVFIDYLAAVRPAMWISVSASESASN